MMILSTISDKILIHRPDCFWNKPKKIFVYGYSGSGKSTIGKKIARKLKYEYVEIDELFWKTANQILGNNINPWIASIPSEVRHQVFKILTEQIKKQDHKIFGGIQISNPDIRYFIFDYPIILMCTSLLVSTYRSSKRDLKKKQNSHGLFGTIKDRIKTQLRIKEGIEKVYNTIIELDNYQFVDYSYFDRKR